VHLLIADLRRSLPLLRLRQRKPSRHSITRSQWTPPPGILESVTDDLRRQLPDDVVGELLAGARTEEEIVRQFRETNRTPGVLIGIWSPKGTFVTACLSGRRD
jgi:hypothetical protein